MAITVGVFTDIDEKEAIDFVQEIAEKTGRASVMIPLTPDQARQIDRWRWLAYKPRGLSVFVRYNYGYEGAGTLPSLNTPQAMEYWDGFRRLIDYHWWLAGIMIGNEPNNPTEAFQGRVLSPQEVGEWVARAWWAAPVRLWIGPPPVDPFNATRGHPYQYFREMLGKIAERNAKIEFVSVQMKTQTSASPMDQERLVFTDDPLKGLSANFGATFDLLRIAWEIVRPKAIVIPELNPQRKQHLPAPIGLNDPLGWTEDSAKVFEWVEEAVGTLLLLQRVFRVDIYVHFYRWSRDQWAIQHRKDIQTAIRWAAEVLHNFGPP